MNSCRDFEGKNVEKAVELACQTLNISKKHLKYDVISSGKTGIFSIIGSKKAKIRVTLDKADGADDNVLSLVDEAFGVKKQKPKKQADTSNAKNRKPERSQRNDKPRPKKPVQESKKSNAVDREQDAPIQKERIISDFYQGRSSEDIGREVLETILNYITDSVEITLDVDGENLTYHVNSEDSAVVIGKRGQNLEAIQYIVDKIVNKHTLERKRVLIDVEGYLEKRRENLEKMALRMSEKVKKTGKPSTISQMSSQDRRIVHLALKEDKAVRTQSMGEGYYRRLVIFPKKGRQRKKKQ